MAVLGAAYAVYEHQQAIGRFTDSMKEVWLPLMKEILPFSLLLILALVVYGLFRAAGSVFERLNGISLAAHVSSTRITVRHPQHKQYEIHGRLCCIMMDALSRCGSGLPI
jgi:hypothetical protein